MSTPKRVVDSLVITKIDDGTNGRGTIIQPSSFLCQMEEDGESWSVRGRVIQYPGYPANVEMSVFKNDIQVSSEGFLVEFLDLYALSDLPYSKGLLSASTGHGRIIYKK